MQLHYDLCTNYNHTCNILFEQCDSTCNNLIQRVIQLQNLIYAVLQLARNTQYNFMI